MKPRLFLSPILTTPTPSAPAPITPDHPPAPHGRRTHPLIGITFALAVALTLSLGGCGDAREGASDAQVAPVEITRATASVIDGMLLADYPGPKGQVHYAGQPEPDFFCNTRDMMYVLLEPEALRKIRAVFVQDMGQADWDEPYGHWIDAHSAFFVVGASKRGSMGPTLATFAREEDALRFAATYGGEVLPYEQITIDSVIPPRDGL